MTRIYTRDMSAITSLVESARQLYLETSRPNVVVHTADQVRTAYCKYRSIRSTSCQELTISSSRTLAHHLTGVAPKIKFVDLSAQSFCLKVSSTPLFVTHANFWILQIGMSKLGFRIVEDIFFMDLLELAKVFSFLFSFFVCFLTKTGLPRFDYLCSCQYFILSLIDIID